MASYTAWFSKDAEGAHPDRDLPLPLAARTLTGAVREAQEAWLAQPGAAHRSFRIYGDRQGALLYEVACAVC